MSVDKFGTSPTSGAEAPGRFRSLAELRTACLDLPAGNDAAAAAVFARQATLTKPPGSLGRLEDVVAWLARWRCGAPRLLEKVRLLGHDLAPERLEAAPAVQRLSDLLVGTPRHVV